MQLFDMHCHLGLMANGEDVAQQAKSCELTLLDTGVLPSEFETEQRRHASNDSVYVACGLHPWWVTDTLKDSEIEQLIERARSYWRGGPRLLECAYAGHRTTSPGIRTPRNGLLHQRNQESSHLNPCRTVGIKRARHSGGQWYLPTGKCHLSLVFRHKRGPHASTQVRVLLLNQ